MKPQPTPSETASNRKLTKPLTERKRRTRINNALNLLKSIVLQAVPPDVVLMSKLEKADLLEMANSYILHLQASKLTGNPGTVSSYSLGFNACAAEVAKYVESHIKDKDGVDGGLHARLLEHLTSYGASRDVVEKCASDRKCAQKIKPLKSRKAKPVMKNEEGISGSGVDHKEEPENDENCTSVTENGACSVITNVRSVFNFGSMGGNEKDPMDNNEASLDAQPKPTTSPFDNLPLPDQITHQETNCNNEHLWKENLRGNPKQSVLSEPKVNENNIKSRESINQKATSSPNYALPVTPRSPLSSIGNRVNDINKTSPNKRLPVNKQPIRKRLSAQYGREVIPRSSAEYLPSNKMTTLQSTSVNFESNENNQKEHLTKLPYQTLDTMKENNLVCASGNLDSGINGADKINEMVELTTRVLTQCSNQIRQSSQVSDKNNCTSLTNYHMSDNRCPVSMVARENMAGTNRLQHEWNSVIQYNVTEHDVSNSDQVWRPW